MKRAIYLFLLFVLTLSISGQAPQKMSYQAVVHNNTGALLINQAIGMKVSILRDSTNGIPVYAETFNPTSNSNGLVTVEIGSGTVVSGSFSSINWGMYLYFIKTEVDLTGGANYLISGVTQLLSVPYSLHSKTTGSILKVTQSERNQLTAQEGAIVYNATSKKPNYYDGTMWRNFDNTSTQISLTTTALSSISSFSADCGGTIITDGGSSVISRGVCWSISPNPTISLSTKTTEGSGTGTYSSVITGLSGNTTYYVRAYATNNAGTDYGNEIQFTTLSLSKIGDNFKGGLIAYFLQSGDLGYDANVKHGLIVSEYNSSISRWGCDNTTNMNANGSGIGAGLSNTELVVNSCSNGSVNAQSYCYNLVESGYDDWFLPSVGELKKVQQNISTLGVSYRTSFWSSTEASGSNGYYVEMISGTQNSWSKDGSFRICPVRKF